MKVTVVYPPSHEHTERLAYEIAEVLGTVAVCAGDARPRSLEVSDLIVLGGPTHKHSPGPEVDAFLAHVANEGLRGVEAAVFDTRLAGSHLLFGSAARRIAKALKRKGASLVVSFDSFLVDEPVGRLGRGELERARAWAIRLLEGAEQLARQRAAGAGPASSSAWPDILTHAGTHFFPAPPITIRWESVETREHESQQHEQEPAGRQ